MVSGCTNMYFDRQRVTATPKPSRSMRQRLRIAALLCAPLATVGCINVFWRTEAVPMTKAAWTLDTLMTTPVKVHLANGNTVVYRDGAFISRDSISGGGEEFALLVESSTPRGRVPMDSVVAFEAFEGKVLGAPTTVVSLAATALGGLTTIVVLKALFGSCPTVYADTGTGPILEAEGFSYAIAPLFEHRDVDRLRARPDSDGVVRLELRNEALETHFINHVELAAVRHEPGTRVLPDQMSKTVAIGDIRPLSAARDRAGRDVSALLATADGQLFTSAPEIADAARVGDLNDWIDLEIPAADLPAGDSIAVVLRLRNSLLNTVLLYDEMLGGPDAMEWLGSQLHQISTAVDLARWYTRTMGLHAIVDGRAVARLNDVGPLAFRDIALVLPRFDSAGVTRVRLRFVADNWRIDYAAIARAVARPIATTVPLARVVVPTPARGGPPTLDSAAVRALSEVDDRYLETRPGQRMTLEFAVPAASGETTYLIAWQGWYREWIRRGWVTSPTRSTAFVPGDSALMSAMQKWRARKVEFERAFYSTRIPVR
jgi:hypothetical protein